MKKLESKRIIRRWLPLAIATTGLVALLYVNVQQQIRLGANEELVRTATDIALSPQLSFASQAQFSDKTDVRNSLSPAVIILDENKKVISSQASLDGRNISPPVGVLDYAKNHPDHRITWQPAKNVRLATVVKYKYGGGYIVVVRNLREAEDLEQSIMLTSLLGLSVILLATLGTIALLESKPAEL